MFKWKLAVLISLLIFIGMESAFATTDCFSTITSAKGPNAISYCITANGNVLQIEGGAIYQLGAYEGYEVVVYTPWGDNSYAYDFGISESGFGNPVITQPNGANTFPLKISRGAFGVTLDQTFARNPDSSILTVTMKVTAWEDWPMMELDLVRVADVSADQDPANTSKAAGQYSVTAFKQGGHGLTVSALTGPVSWYAVPYADDCNARHAPAPLGTELCLSYHIHLPNHPYNNKRCCDAWGATRTVAIEYKLF